MRLHHNRSAHELDASDLLNVEFNRDPFAGEGRRQAHGFFLAEPLTGRPDMLLALTDVPATAQALLYLRTQAYSGELQTSLHQVGAAQLSPAIEEMQSLDRRPSGAAMSTYGIGPGRVRRVENGFTDNESEAELEVRDNGGLRIYTSRLSDDPGNANAQAVFESVAVGFAHRLVALAAAVGTEAGYFGNWALAFGATGLQGAYSFRRSQGRGGGREGSPYAEDIYKEATLASYAELTTQAPAIVDRLVGRFLRAFGTRTSFLPVLTVPETPDI